MRTGWKQGVVGIDDGDSEKTQVFYASMTEDRMKRAAEKEAINVRRRKCKYFGLHPFLSKS